MLIPVLADPMTLRLKLWEGAKWDAFRLSPAMTEIGTEMK